MRVQLRGAFHGRLLSHVRQIRRTRSRRCTSASALPVPTTSFLSGLNRTAPALDVYARSADSRRSTQDSLAAGGQPSCAGLPPAGFVMRFQSCLHHFLLTQAFLAQCYAKELLCIARVERRAQRGPHGVLPDSKLLGVPVVGSSFKILPAPRSDSATQNPGLREEHESASVGAWTTTC
jgi:hypothetical protein